MKNGNEIEVRYLTSASADATPLPGGDVMGMGYDINGEFAKVESTKGQNLFEFPEEKASIIIDGREYAYNDLFGVNKIYRTNFETVQGAVIDRYQESLSLSVGVSGQYKLFSGSVKTSFDSESLRQEETTYTTIREAHKLWQINLPPSTLLKPYLREDVRNMLNNPSIPADTVFDKFGACYIGEAIIGGRIDSNAATKTLKVENANKIAVDAEVSLGMMIGKVDVDVNSSLYKEISNFRENSSQTLQTEGGKPGLASRILHGPDSQGAYSEWAESLLDFAVLMDFTNESLRPIWELVDDAKRREDLELAFPNWMKNQELTVVKEKRVLGLADSIMERVGTDAGSGAKKDLSIWVPKIDPSAGYFYGGQFAQANHHIIAEGRTKIFKDLFDLGYLKPPTGFVKIWDDGGSGKKKDYACWRPVPPVHYRALGDVMALGISSGSFPVTLQRGLYCVHKSLCRDVTRNDIGYKIWNDAGTGARNDLSLWQLKPINSHTGVNLETFLGSPRSNELTNGTLSQIKGIIGILKKEFTIDE